MSSVLEVECTITLTILFFLMKDHRVALEIIYLVRTEYFSEKVTFLTP